jgi:hypothetical protein
MVLMVTRWSCTWYKTMYGALPMTNSRISGSTGRLNQQSALARHFPAF